MATQSSAGEPSASTRERFLDWLYEHPDATLSQFPDPQVPARRSYLPSVQPSWGDSTDTRARVRPVTRIPAPPIPRPIHEIARAAPNPEDPWTWSTATTAFPSEREGIWRYRLMELRDAGLITESGRPDRMPEASALCALTDAGKKDVEQRRIRRKTQRQWRRQIAAMDGLLHWLNEQDPNGERWNEIDGVLESRYARFEGEHLPEDSFRRAAEYLQQSELIRGDGNVGEIPGPLTAQITIRGQTCIESGGSVADHLSRQNEHPASNTTNIGHVSGGNIALHSTYVTQTTTTSGLASDEIGDLVRAIVEALPALGLPEEKAAEIRSNTHIIEGELARREQDPHIVKTMMSRTLEALTGATSSTLGLLLTGYAKELMKRAGLPIE